MDPASKQAAKYKTAAVLGIINDKLEVGMAKIRGEDSAALDVAIIKATLQDEVVPKEKHVRTLKIACNGSSPRQTVNYVIHGLAKRLEENPKAWLVTLKTLIVFHRLMRETDPTFQEELLRYAERTGHHRMLRLESFADHTTKETWDLSAWIRVYSLYLDERLAVFRSMRFDPEQDQGLEARESKLKSCPVPELLEHLPAVQRLLGRLVSCVPEGAAQSNEVALLACSLVLKEVRSVYKVVSEGVLNLVDRFFEMDRGDALKGVELVKENLAVNERLNAFVSTIGNISPLRGAVQFPSVQPLPADFLTTLEEYIKDAPRGAGDVAKPVVGRASTAQRGGTSQALGGTGPRLVVGGPIKDPSSGPTSPQPVAPPAPAAPPVVDLLGFDSLSVNPTPPATAAPVPPPGTAPGMPPAAPPAPAAAPFDPFSGFGGAPAPAAAAPLPAPAAPAAPPPYAAGLHGNNPFGAPSSAGAGGMFSPNAPQAPSAWAAPAGAPAVITQQVGGYNLKKPADPLMDLSLDLFGKQQAAPPPQPMRPQGPAGAPPNGGGSPGAPF
ncbi:hypothetical protein GPECTOR_5g293 [Gonium pectorale]|uniref:ENTH domain-containing protein n=1 Tax=Gonium pectorale TaxID=33097 RepID=A0A150GWM3_GONPE|nr:hypothetical protein GPECTOR_5g293 [Gonium pectorale]|eukprot:KXZ54199.1 hypothetical protein GPECTOR_5g293 [Gonium pectorale]